MSAHDNDRRNLRRVQVMGHWGEIISTSGDYQLNEYAFDLGLRRVNDNATPTINNINNSSSNRRAEENVRLQSANTGLRRTGLMPSVTLRLTFPPLDSLISTNQSLPYCECYKENVNETCCPCEENDTGFDWVWDVSSKSVAAQLQNCNREVSFHTEYSCGTASVRGTSPMVSDQHYWEIKMTSPVYGTDMMVGVGTADADLNRHRYTFCSFLGSDCETWGLSYTGLFHHKGQAICYCPRFGQGSIIGVHLDMWNGTLSFYKNRQPLGIACGGLKGKTLFPMVSSTAARSGMKMIRSRSFNSSLQYLCCLSLRKSVPSEKGVLDVFRFPPGLAAFLSNNLGWLLDPLVSSSGGHECTPSSSGCEDHKPSFHTRPLGSSFPSTGIPPEILPCVALKPRMSSFRRTTSTCKKRKLFEYHDSYSSSSESDEDIPELSGGLKRKNPK